MSSWLDSINLEMEKLEEKTLIQPMTEIEDYDNSVGEASMELKKLYGLSQALKKKAMETIVKFKFSSDANEKNELASHIKIAHDKAEMLLQIFWVVLRDEFDLWDKDNVGIRKGWEVVWSDDQHPSLPDILGHIFGGPFGPQGE